MADGLIDLAWLVYFIETLATEDYNSAFGMILVTSFIGYLSYVIVPIEEWNEGLQQKIGNISKTGIIIGVVYGAYYGLVPSKETAWTVTGIVMAAKVVENPEIQELTSEGVNILNKKLQVYSKELDKKLGINTTEHKEELGKDD